MQTDAVDCDALSTPVFKIETKGENINDIIVGTSILLAFD